ncbi:hypothetical protein EVAR_65035_1 [Eumeta japonica]|uniref:Uncharacterized protein n=1 Tax=Eumeta variegata TaxID=151549 RepID=A0A4C1YW44_EUMVA|nr:hypothetical protein EVAR_65035_1 [Eumeta japonica]
MQSRSYGVISKFRREYRRAFCCAPTGQPEPMSTLSRGTTSNKGRRKTQSISLPTVAHCRSSGRCGVTCDTHFIENGSKNGLLS